MSSQLLSALLSAGCGLVVIASVWIGVFAFLQVQRRRLRAREASLGDVEPANHLAAIAAAASLGGGRRNDPNGPLGRAWLQSLQRSELHWVRGLLFLNLAFHYSIGVVLAGVTGTWLYGMGGALLRALAR